MNPNFLPIKLKQGRILTLHPGACGDKIINISMRIAVITFSPETAGKRSIRLLREKCLVNIRGYRLRGNPEMVSGI
jgi:hypothetical protein